MDIQRYLPSHQLHSVLPLNQPPPLFPCAAFILPSCDSPSTSVPECHGGEFFLETAGEKVMVCIWSPRAQSLLSSSGEVALGSSSL